MAGTMFHAGRFRWAECENPKGRRVAPTVIVRAEAQDHKAARFYRLQELWVAEDGSREEWRDVPVGKVTSSSPRS